MPSQENQALDDRLLTRYLLGALPEQQAERLHELSFTDEELAVRLDALENDLVDGYVRGELSPEDLSQFKTFYLSSSGRQQKVAFAAGLLALERRTGAASARAQADKELGPSQVKKKAPSSWRMFLVPRFAFQGALAALLIAVLLSGYLLFQNLQLRKQVTEAQAQHATGDLRTQELERQLNQERTARAEALNQLQQARQSHPNLDALKTLAVVLPAPMRGSAQIPTVHLHPGTDLMVLVLSLESDDFPVYRAALRDPVANQSLWRSTNLKSTSAGERKAVAVSLPAAALKQQNYVIDLTGVPIRGGAEVIGSYPFRVVLQ